MKKISKIIGIDIKVKYNNIENQNNNYIEGTSLKSVNDYTLEKGIYNYKKDKSKITLSPFTERQLHEIDSYYDKYKDIDISDVLKLQKIL